MAEPSEPRPAPRLDEESYEELLAAFHVGSFTKAYQDSVVAPGIKIAAELAGALPTPLCGIVVGFLSWTKLEFATIVFDAKKAGIDRSGWNITATPEKIEAGWAKNRLAVSLADLDTPGRMAESFVVKFVRSLHPELAVKRTETRLTKIIDQRIAEFLAKR